MLQSLRLFRFYATCLPRVSVAPVANYVPKIEFQFLGAFVEICFCASKKTWKVDWEKQNINSVLDLVQLYRYLKKTCSNEAYNKTNGKTWLLWLPYRFFLFLMKLSFPMKETLTLPQEILNHVSFLLTDDGGIKQVNDDLLK